MCMGLPSILTTDNGSEFKNKLNDAMMKQLGIRHCLITRDLFKLAILIT